VGMARDIEMGAFVFHGSINPKQVWGCHPAWRVGHRRLRLTHHEMVGHQSNLIPTAGRGAPG